MEKRIKALNISITVALTICFCLLGYFVFSGSYLRIGEVFIDLWNSIKFYCMRVIGAEWNVDITVIKPSETFGWSSYIPEDADGFQESSNGYFQLLFSGENIRSYISYLGEFLAVVSKGILIFLPGILGVVLLVKMIYGQTNTKHNQDTVPLKVYKRISKLFVPIREYVKQYVQFVKDHAAICIVWLVIWALNLNVVGVVIEFIAFYLYFAVSFDIASIYVVVAKLIIDLNVVTSPCG